LAFWRFEVWAKCKLHAKASSLLCIRVHGLEKIGEMHIFICMMAVMEFLWHEPKRQAHHLDAKGKMPKSMFPQQCPWTFEQVTHLDFWPEAA